jgi:hypothetical protein
MLESRLRQNRCNLARVEATVCGKACSSFMTRSKFKVHGLTESEFPGRNICASHRSGNYRANRLNANLRWTDSAAPTEQTDVSLNQKA